MRDMAPVIAVMAGWVALAVLGTCEIFEVFK